MEETTTAAKHVTMLKDTIPMAVALLSLLVTWSRGSSLAVARKIAFYKHFLTFEAIRGQISIDPMTFSESELVEARENFVKPRFVG